MQIMENYYYNNVNNLKIVKNRFVNSSSNIPINTLCNEYNIYISIKRRKI